MPNKIFLIEDHDEALKIWRVHNIKNLDLVHVDAHIDFGFPAAKSFDSVLKEAESIQDLKKGLEQSLAFRQFETDFDKQTNIGNYIYPAIQEGIVRDFYWVVPGDIETFLKSGNFIKNIIAHITSRIKCNKNTVTISKLRKGRIDLEFLGRKLIICILDKLPALGNQILIDIDTDFLVIDSLVTANNTANIGKRKPWILPSVLVTKLKEKIAKPSLITIAYSVNGGYTPICYKYLGDEIAFNFSPGHFRERLFASYRAKDYFTLFNKTNDTRYYKKAVKIDPLYRVYDNNYGPLYLSTGELEKAKKEFFKILKADPKNPGALSGMGNVMLSRKNYKQAKKYFSIPLSPMGRGKGEGILGSAKAEFGLKNYKIAKKLLLKYKVLNPLNPESYYLLGIIAEKEKSFNKAINLYKNSLKLGINNPELLYKLLRISYHIEKKGAILDYVKEKFLWFKHHFLKAKKQKMRNRKRIKKQLDKIQHTLTKITLSPMGRGIG